MKLFWYPELGLLDDPKAQSRALDWAIRECKLFPHGGTWSSWISIGAMALAALVCYIVGAFWLCWILLILAAVAAPGSALWTKRTVVRQKLREYLNRNGVPVCMGCGYCLRGLTAWYCPECGRVIERF
ncbi:MAG: hypothetical protein AB7Q17_06175 [Phycisphaerae bacterium]